MKGDHELGVILHVQPDPVTRRDTELNEFRSEGVREFVLLSVRHCLVEEVNGRPIRALRHADLEHFNAITHACFE
jgi:hypothetical protein